MRALLVEKDALQAKILSSFLFEGGFAVEVRPEAPDDPPDVELIVIDHALAADFLRANRQRPVAERLPVVLLVDDAHQEDVIEGLRAGHYTAGRPVTRALLLALADRAVRSRSRLKNFSEELQRDHQGLQLMAEAKFRFRTRAEACAIAGALSHAFPKPSAVSMGLLELMVNAVEHGNLEIGGPLKQRLIEAGDLDAEIERRQAGPLGQRFASVEFRRHPEHIELIVEDQGPGFDEREVAPGLDQAAAYHGRGIAMARAMSFDRLEYEPPGRRAIATILLPREHEGDVAKTEATVGQAPLARR